MTGYLKFQQIHMNSFHLNSALLIDIKQADMSTTYIEKLLTHNYLCQEQIRYFIKLCSSASCNYILLYRKARVKHLLYKEGRILGDVVFIRQLNISNKGKLYYST